MRVGAWVGCRGQEALIYVMVFMHGAHWWVSWGLGQAGARRRVAYEGVIGPKQSTWDLDGKGRSTARVWALVFQGPLWLPFRHQDG